LETVSRIQIITCAASNAKIASSVGLRAFLERIDWDANKIDYLIVCVAFCAFVFVSGISLTTWNRLKSA
jgi:hypothetical protein